MVIESSPLMVHLIVSPTDLLRVIAAGVRKSRKLERPLAIKQNEIGSVRFVIAAAPIWSI